jgi:hypothetical protein
MFPDPNNGATYDPESETSRVESGKRTGFLLVGKKMADKKLGEPHGYFQNVHYF